MMRFISSRLHGLKIRLEIPSEIHRGFWWTRILLGVLLGLTLTWAAPATAIPVYPNDLAHQPITEVKVSLGNSANELKFFPNQLEFVSGKLYKLILDNPSPQKHYFTAKDFADASWTALVKTDLVEVKGAIHELELLPTGKAEWMFVPAKAGTYSLRCTIPGHTEAGMTGEITILAS